MDETYFDDDEDFMIDESRLTFRNREFIDARETYDPINEAILEMQGKTIQ